jgi:lysophospholipase L1-like esterase
MSLAASLARAAPVSSNDVRRFAAEFERFAKEDAQYPPPPNPVLFVGSSSIRLWTNLADSFPTWRPLNRGFGGATMTDLLAAFDRVVTPYRPRALVVYCGENDIARGRDAIETANDYEEFLRRCHRLRPDMLVAVLSMKPSPRRWALWPAMQKANERIREICAAHGGDYLDVGTCLLVPSGIEPDPQLFRPDQLHLNDRGYARWQNLLAQWLDRRLGSAASVSAGSAPNDRGLGSQ